MHFEYESNLEPIRRDLLSKKQNSHIDHESEANKENPSSKKNKKPEIKQIVFTIAYLATAFLVIWFTLRYGESLGFTPIERMPNSEPQVELQMSPEEFAGETKN